MRKVQVCMSDSIILTSIYVETDATKPIRLSVDIIDRLLIARLDLDPQSMS